MTPAQQALAFRIWAYAKPRRWKVGVADLAEALGSGTTQIHRVLIEAGWRHRVRSSSASQTAAYEIGLHAMTGFGSIPAVDTFAKVNVHGAYADD